MLLPKKTPGLVKAGLLVAGYYLYRRWRQSKSSPIPFRVGVSSPEQERPTLARFDGLNALPNYEKEKLPTFPDDETNRGNYRLLRLEGARGPSFFVHIYNGSLAQLPLQVYGVGQDNQAEPLLEKPTLIIKAAQRVPVGENSEKYTSFFVRFALSGQDGEPIKFRETNVVSIAVYNEEPVAKGGIDMEYPGSNGTTGSALFSHEKNTFQSVVISSCDVDLDLKAWARQTKLEIKDSYFGPLGGAILLGIEPGLSPNTSGAHIVEEIEQDTHKGAAGPNYVINQYNSDEPQRRGGGTEPKSGGGEAAVPYTDFSSKGDPVTVSIIDGGVDNKGDNANFWKPSIYRSPRESEFVKRGALGYDFIDRDFDPQDATSHGTYVAGVIGGYYRGNRPLEMVHFRTFGKEGISTYFGALVSIYEAATIGSHVINMSWGMYADVAPPALECAIKVAIRQHCFLVTSAGNGETDLDSNPQWPAAFAGRYPKNVVTVASYKLNDEGKPRLSDFTNYGKKRVSVAAYESARTPQLGSANSVFPEGTSISAPLVTAALATVLASDPEAQIGSLYQLFDRPLVQVHCDPERFVYADSYLVTEADTDAAVLTTPADLVRPRHD